MALTADERAALSEEAFAVPGKRALPLVDERHIRMAWGQLNASGLTDDEKSEARRRILAKASELKLVLKAATQGLYVSRRLTPESAADLVEWAKSQGFLNIEPADEMHVTIVHSRTWPALAPDGDLLLVSPSSHDDRKVLPLGPKGAVVLRFESPGLEARWQQAIDAGATWDFDGYLPHVTIAYSGSPVDFDDIAPFTGDLVFGPEEFKPNEEMAPMRMEAVGVLLEGETLEAMALSMPDVAGHPNRMPFSGILTRLDQPSDRAPLGSKGKRVIFTKSAAERALPSLMGMGVDFTPNFDGHDTTRKIGVITGAHIEGNAVHVDGIIYARDFPTEASRIQTDKKVLGFSWELADIYVERLDADPLVITDAYFTGAAILRKDKAAFNSTSLAASAEEITMTKEEIAAAMGEALAPAIKPLTDAMAAFADASVKQIEALTAMQASAATQADEKAKADQEARDKEVEDLKGQVAELRAAADKKASEPERKTLPPGITALLAKADLAVPAGDEKMSVGAVDQALSKAGLEPVQRMQVKNELARAGKL